MVHYLSLVACLWVANVLTVLTVILGMNAYVWLDHRLRYRPRPQMDERPIQ